MTSVPIVQVPPLPDLLWRLRGGQFVADSMVPCSAPTWTVNQAVSAARCARAGAWRSTCSPRPRPARRSLNHLHLGGLRASGPGHRRPSPCSRDVMLEVISPPMVEAAGHRSASPRTVCRAAPSRAARCRGQRPAQAPADGLDAPYVYFAVGVPMTPEFGTAISATLAQLDVVLAPCGVDRAYLNFAEERRATSSMRF